MMRIAAKVDANQAEIVAALRQAGCSVELLHRVGRNAPDLLVGRAGANYLIEAKSEGGKLSEGQKLWHLRWAGQVGTAWTIEEAFEVVGLKERRTRL